MGWVRGQTGEQKKERKAKTSRGSGLVGSGQEDLGGVAEAVAPRRAAFTGWERAPGRGDPRRPTVDLPGRLKVGAAQGFSVAGEGAEGKQGREARASSRDPGPQCCTNGPAWAAPSRTRPEAAGPAGGRAEPPASQVAYSLSKAGLLNLQASL